MLVIIAVLAFRRAKHRAEWRALRCSSHQPSRRVVPWMLGSCARPGCSEVCKGALIEIFNQRIEATGSDQPREPGRHRRLQKTRLTGADGGTSDDQVQLRRAHRGR